MDSGWIYYCNHCQKDVRVDVEAYIEHISQLSRIVVVGVSVTCVECKATLDGDDARMDLER